MNDAESSIDPERPPTPATAIANFYGTPALDEELEAARRISGLEDEIARLRVELKMLFNADAVDLKLIARTVDTLVRAVATQYRLSPTSKADLAANLAGVINSLGDQLIRTDR